MWDTSTEMNRLKDGTPQEIFSRHQQLKELSLDVPAPVQLAELLRQRGVEIPPQVGTTDELVRCLCQLQ